ncbi:MAG: hypothetical protein PHY47_05200 [Lachnospiraceae bacterium]|nr:hypothetical protein [Lachnospiraceae bacterium]
MKELLKNKKNGCIMGVIMVLSVIIMIYYGNHKEYLYYDEVLSYTAANNPTGLSFKFQPNTWYQGYDFVKPLTVQAGHRFDYAMVWANQASDTHPPFYHTLLHTICSFFPGVFSKWFALSINIVALLIIEIIVYKIATLIFKNNKWLPFITVMAYIGSIAVITQMMFLRMYMVQQIFTSLALLLHIKFFNEKIKNKSFFIALFITTILGALTQYYYLLFAFFLAVYFCIYLLFTSHIKEVLGYAITMLGSMTTAFLIFPATIKHLFGGEVGSTAVDNIFGLNRVKERLLTIYVEINKEVFGSNFKLFLFIIVCFVIVKIVKKQFRINSSDVLIGGMFLFIALSYYIVVSMITPYLCDRYFAPIFLVLIFLLVGTLHMIFKNIFSSETVMYVILTAIVLSPMYLQLKSNITDTSKLEMLRLADENSDTVCVVDASIDLENFMELSKYKNIYVVDMSNETEFDNKVRNTDKLVVYLPLDCTIDDLTQKIYKANSNLSSYDRLYVAYRATVYEIY